MGSLSKAISQWLERRQDLKKFKKSGWHKMGVIVSSMIGPGVGLRRLGKQTHPSAKDGNISFLR